MNDGDAERDPGLRERAEVTRAATEEANRLRRLQRRMHSHPVSLVATKFVVAVIGLALVAAGIVMLVAPGPGIVAILFGLAVLATEFSWAERWLTTMRDRARRAKERAEAMDPTVRRRRILLTLGALLVVVGAVIGYVVAYDWPGFAVSGWDWVQSIATWLPELPGM